MFGWLSRISRISVDPEPIALTMKMGPARSLKWLASLGADGDRRPRTSQPAPRKLTGIAADNGREMPTRPPTACSSSTTSRTSSTSSRWRCASRASRSRPPTPASEALAAAAALQAAADGPRRDAARHGGLRGRRAGWARARAAIPIIFLTARDATEDKVRGLTIGGDDYVTKPFTLEELRRPHPHRAAPHRPGRGRLAAALAFEDLELDEDTREVTRAGAPIDLTATEYRLLRYLLLNPRRVLDARPDPRPRLGLRLRRRRPRPRDVHLLPAQEARRATARRSSTPCAASATRCARRGAS